MYGVQDIHYASDRLIGTFVRVRENNSLFEVSNIGIKDDSLVLFGYNKHGEKLEKSVSELNLASPPLGYFFDTQNYTAKYAFRVPRRRDWRQGIRPSSIYYTIKGTIQRFNSNMYLLEQPIQNTYFSFKECLESIKTYSSVPISKDYSIDYQYNIWYKGMKSIGLYSSEKIILYRKFFYHIEALNESLDEERKIDATDPTNFI